MPNFTKRLITQHSMLLNAPNKTPNNETPNDTKHPLVQNDQKKTQYYTSNFFREKKTVMFYGWVRLGNLL